MGDKINVILDNLLSLTWRVIDLPMLVLIPLLIAILLILSLIARLFKVRSSSIVKYFFFGFFVLGFALLVDRKFAILKSEIQTLNEKYIGLMNSRGSSGGKKLERNFLMDVESLKSNFTSELKVWQQNLNQAVDLITVKKEEPNAVFYIAAVDLSFPGIEIAITPELKEKYLTSIFAHQNDCFLAINGEAGRTMYPGCGLGEWTGNWIVRGNPVQMTDTKERPFLSFDKSNKAKYVKAVIVDTTLTEDKYNAIWGRFDILVDNEIVEDTRNTHYSRTVMGINGDGNILYLMIVDGKRPEHSLGLTYAECASVMKLVGATNAMACDQGGSSCMYVKGKGIINRPADSEGIERPVYTHFGIRIPD